MMTKELESKFVPWTWIVSLLLGILLLVGGYYVNDTSAKVNRLEEKKVDRIEFDRVYAERNATLAEIKTSLAGLQIELKTLGQLIIKSNIRAGK